MKELQSSRARVDYIDSILRLHGINCLRNQCRVAFRIILSEEEYKSVSGCKIQSQEPGDHFVVNASAEKADFNLSSRLAFNGPDHLEGRIRENVAADSPRDVAARGLDIQYSIGALHRLQCSQPDNLECVSHKSSTVGAAKLSYGSRRTTRLTVLSVKRRNGCKARYENQHRNSDHLALLVFVGFAVL
jgi:hypothetical protein